MAPVKEMPVRRYLSMFMLQPFSQRRPNTHHRENIDQYWVPSHDRFIGILVVSVGWSENTSPDPGTVEGSTRSVILLSILLNHWTIGTKRFSR